MRAPNGTTDFTVPIDGIGTFVFAKKGIRDQFAVEAEYSRLTEGVPSVTDFLGRTASAFAEIKVLAVEVPAGFDLEAMDPEEIETYTKLMTVWGALREKQASFRSGAKGKSESGGTAAQGHPGVLVPPQVQPAAD